MSTLLENLNPAQQAAVQHDSGPALVLAGAGSGKTTVLTTRVAWLIQEKKVNPEAILLVTFTNKAAGEMKTRVQDLTQLSLASASTFHSFCARILRIYGQTIGLAPGFSIYDTDDQLTIIKRILKDQHKDSKKMAPRAVAAKISHAKNELLSPSDFRSLANSFYLEQVADVYEAYQQALTDIQAVDFDDILNRVIELLQTNPDVLTTLQRKYQHILVDEYQDTNKAQYLLSKLLAAPNNDLFVVGDFAQSIYSWRGADLRNMLQLQTDFPEITEYRLEQNYRSTQTILTAASNVIAANSSHPVLTLWTDRPDAEPITLSELPDTTAEAELVAKQLRSLQGIYSLSDMAILYRTNAQSRAFEEVFVRSGIPYRIVGGVTFYERKEIKDVLSYLKIVSNPLDEASLTRAQKIGKRRLAQFQAWLEKNQAQAQQSLTSNPSQLLTNVLRETGYLDLYEASDPEDLARLENIQELRSVAAQFSSLTQMLENIALIQDGYFIDVESERSEEVVQMMSLHSAKGLEFSVIFLVGLEDGLLPHSRSVLDPDGLEEERRLFYVGLTRAKHRLYLSHTRSRFMFNTRTQNIPSRFLKDIPAQLLLVTNPARKSYLNSSPSATTHATKPTRSYTLDDDMLTAALQGEIDFEEIISL